MGMSYRGVFRRRDGERGERRVNVERPGRGTRPGRRSRGVLRRQRHFMVINRPMIISENPMAKFHEPRSIITGILSPAM